MAGELGKGFIMFGASTLPKSKVAGFNQTNETANWFFNLQQKPCPQSIDTANAKIISKVAQSSPAMRLGISEGDKLLRINGVDACGLDIDDLLLHSLSQGQNIHYQIYSKKRHALLDFDMVCLPLGVRFHLDAQALFNPSLEYQTDKTDLKIKYFCSLWEAGEYDKILKIGECIQPQDQSGFLGRILRRNDTQTLGTQEQAMLAIGKYEVEKTKENIKNLQYIIKADIQEWHAYLQAIAYYYLACIAKENSDLLYYSQYLNQAVRLNPNSERIKKAAKSVGRPVAEKPSLLGRLLPDHYMFVLDNLEKPIGLKQMLEHLAHNQVLPICFMKSEKTNKNFLRDKDAQVNTAFDEAIKAYRLMGGYVGRYFAPIVIIHDNHQEAAHFLNSEQAKGALADGLPLSMLEIVQGNIFADLGIQSSPDFLVINKSGRVIWEKGLKDSYDYWNLLHILN